MSTITVKDAGGNPVDVELPVAVGRAAAAASKPVVLSTEDAAYLDGLETLLTAVGTKLDTLHTDLATTLAGLVDGLEGILGVTSGAAVITDANGTVQQYLRGLVKQWIAGTLVVGAGTNLIGKVKTKFIEAAASAAMTRPNDTTAYAANDAVANSTTSGSVTPFTFTVSDVNDDPVTIERLRLSTTDTGAQGKNLRIWLFQAAPTPGAGDNAAFTVPKAGFIGTMSGTLRATSDGAVGIFVPDEGSRIIAKPVSGAATVRGLLQTLEAFTPVAQSTWTPTVEGFQGG